MKVAYETVKFTKVTQPLVDEIVTFTDGCAAIGRRTNVQQIFVWLASRDLIPWDDNARERVTRLVSRARLYGLVDWDVVADLSNPPQRENYWDCPEEMLHACADQYKIDKWAEQEVYVECWVGHRPASPTIQDICRAEYVPYVVNVAASWGDIWNALKRIKPRLLAGKTGLILYFGDCNPHAVMAAKNDEERLRRLLGPELSRSLRFDWLAVTKDLAEASAMRPLALKGSVSSQYTKQYGLKAWSLDAVDDMIVKDLLTVSIDNVRDERLWREACQREDEGRTRLAELARIWDKRT